MGTIEFITEIWARSVLLILGIGFLIDAYEPLSKWKTLIGVFLIVSQQAVNKWMDNSQTN